MGNRVKIAQPPLHFASSHASWLSAFDLKVKIVMIIIILLKGCILNILIIEGFLVTKIVSKFGDFRDCHVKYHIIFTFHSILYCKHLLLYILNITCEMF